jgi:hypothetical protein
MEYAKNLTANNNLEDIPVGDRIVVAPRLGLHRV